MHGLHGKKLLYDSPRQIQSLSRAYADPLLCSYFTSVFVSLGVFVFGYDQGVMSGIITYV